MRISALLCATLLAIPATVWAHGADTTETDTALTIYNSGAAVVSQRRRVDLEAGRQTLPWPDTPAQLQPDSVWLAGDGVVLDGATIARHADNDHASPTTLLATRIGKRVTLVSPDGHAEKQATLVSTGDGHAVVRVDDQLQWIDMSGPWRLTWPAPEQGAARAPLQLTLTAEDAGRQPVTLVFQRPDINWHASYTGRYDAASGILALQSLAVISNASASRVQADHVTLLAGAVNRSSAATPRPLFSARKAAAGAAADSVPQAEKTAVGYYQYKLDQPLELAAGATQLQPLMNARSLPAEREYYVNNPGSQISHAQVRLHLKNTTDKPWPAGPVRIYAHDGARLVGADQMGNTASGVPVTLSLGKAFDITAKKQLLKDRHEEQKRRRVIAITVHNAGNEAAAITIDERLPNGAKIVSESVEHEHKTADQASWIVDAPAHGKITLKYALEWTQ